MEYFQVMKRQPAAARLSATARGCPSPPLLLHSLFAVSYSLRGWCAPRSANHNRTSLNRIHTLQKIITNDATKLTPGGPPLYACVLTPHGRFLHYMFLHPLEGSQVPTVLVDCDSGQRRALMDLFQRWGGGRQGGAGWGRAGGRADVAVGRGRQGGAGRGRAGGQGRAGGAAPSHDVLSSCRSNF